MPSVPYSPVPNVAPSTSVPSDYFTQQANPNDFGAQVGQAVQGLGQTLDKAGDLGMQQALARQGIFNENTASQAQINLDQQYTKAYSDFSQLRGQNAVGGVQAYNQSLSDARTAAIQAMPNLQSQNMLAKGSVYLLQRSMMMGAQHVDTEQQQFFKDNQQAIIENATQQGAFYSNSPSQITAYAIQAADAATEIAKHNGASDETAAAMRAETLGKFYRNTIGTLAQTNPAAAMTLFNSVRGTIDGPSQEAIGASLKEKTDTAGDSAYVAGLFAHAGVGGGTSGVADAIMGQEASRPNDVSPKGAAGKMQVTPAFFQTYKQGGESFDNETDRVNVGRRGIGQLSNLPNVNGDPARIAVGYFSGPGNIAPPGSSTPWIRDIDDGTPEHPGTKTSAYVAGVLARLNGKGGDTGPSPRSAALAAPSYPDESAIIQKVIADNPDPEVQARRLSRVKQALGTLRLATETDRRDLTNSLPDLQASARGGNDITIPEDRIHRLLPPAQAARELEQLNVAKQAGQVFKAVQWGTPDQVNAAYQDLSSGLGPISTMIRNTASRAGASAGGITAPPGTAAPGSDQETPEAYRLRTQILNKFTETVQKRTAALVDDPAGYVQSEPGVAAAAAAVKGAPNDPAALAAYNTATLATQTSLGVPEGQQHILTKARAQTQAHQLMTVDPSKGDMGQALAGIAQQYGAAWPQAFGDLVKLGKLSPDYQVLAAMPDPVARTDFQRALAAVSVKGGVAQLKEDVPPQAAKDIDTGLDDKLADFRRTASIPGLSGNVALTATVRDSIKTLAYYYAMQSGDGPKSLDRAADAVINSKYDFSDTMRVPKGMLSVAETTTANLQASLKPGDLMPLAADTQATDKGPGMTVEQRQAVTLKAARSGSWVPNENDTGLVLVGKMGNGAMVQMRRTDGSRIEMPFKGMTQAAQGQTAPPAINPTPSLQ